MNLKQLRIEAKNLTAKELSVKYGYTYQGMFILLKRHKIKSKSGRIPATHCRNHPKRKVYIGARCQECYNEAMKIRQRERVNFKGLGTTGGYPFKFNSYEPACFLPENWEAQPRLQFKNTRINYVR